MNVNGLSEGSLFYGKHLKNVHSYQSDPKIMLQKILTIISVPTEPNVLLHRSVYIIKIIHGK